MTDTAPQATAVRLRHLDNLKTALVGYVIAGHALVGYSSLGGWAYGEIREVTLAPPSELILEVILGPLAMVVIGMFFFLTGLLTEGALIRHGWRQYVSDRVQRLGLPWLVSAVLLWPVSVWIAYRGAGRSVSVWWVFTHRNPFLDSGSLWFALVLLIFSVVFAAYSAVFHRSAAVAGHRAWAPLTGFGLTVVVAGIAVASFIVRIWFPVHSRQIADLHLWWWPQCLAMFGLGIVASRRGWHRNVPDRVRRGCGVVVLVTLLVVPVLAYVTGLRSLARGTDRYLGGWHWQALTFAAVESTLVVSGSIWLVGVAERRLDRSGARATSWSSAAFGAFVVQGPVLMLLATAARPFELPAEIKAPLVAAIAVIASFWLSRLLTSLFSPRAAGSHGPTPAAALKS